MKYLGAMISSDGSIDREPEQRIKMALKMIGAIGSTVYSYTGKEGIDESMCIRMKLRVVNAMVIPTLTYRCEACMGFAGKT